MNKETLTQEISDINASIIEKQSEIEAANTAIHWLKKRLKLAENQLNSLSNEGNTRND